MEQIPTKKYVEEKRDLFKQLDAAIEKTFDPANRSEGLQELKKLLGQDDCVPFFIGYAHEQTFYDDKNQKEEAVAAIKEYEKCVKRGGYEFLKETLETLKSEIEK